MRHITRIFVALLLTMFVAAGAKADLPAHLTQATLGMKAGVRISYVQASALVGATGINLVPDANGNWVDVRTGQPYAEGTGTAGAGVSLFDIYAMDSQILCFQHTYLANTVSNAFTPASQQVLVGTPSSNLAEIWINPAVLAKQANVNQKDLRVVRINYTLDGRTFKAIRIQANVGNAGWTQSTYDLQTGLLIIQSQAVKMPETNGNGGTAIAFQKLTSERALNALGMGTRFDASVKTAKSYVWASQSTTSVANSGGVTTNATLGYTGFVWSDRTVKFNVTLNGKASGSLTLIAGQVGGLWIPPAQLKALKTNAVIDSESALGIRLQVGTAQNGVVPIYFVWKTGYTVYAYQTSTGHLVGVYRTETTGISQTVNQVSLTSRK